MSRRNGGIIGPTNTPVGGLTTGVAGGVWRMNDVLTFVSNSQWPKGPENIENSCRFNDDSSDYLTRTPSSESNRKKLTFSVWVKRSNLASSAWMWFIHNGDASDGNPSFGVGFKNDSVSIIDLDSSGSYDTNLITNRLFRDVSAWYHILVAFDTTQGTAANRVRLYVNGTEETSFSTSTYPSQDHEFNTAPTMTNFATEIGRDNYSGGDAYYDGYMAEMVLVDGQQLTPSSFGETDSTTGIWKPKKIGQQFGSVGTNGFYLDFKDSSNLGNDASGLNNDFTVNNLTSIDQSTDTCVENFATLNPLNVPTSNAPVMSEGNLQTITMNSDPGYFGGTSTMGASQGKWYAEIKVTDDNGVGTVGITFNPGETARQGTTFSAQIADSFVYANTGKQYSTATGTSGSSYGNTYTDNDIIGIAMDLDNSKLYFSKNGTFQNSGDPTSGSTGTGAISITAGETYFFYLTDVGGTLATYQCNFGSPPFSISSGNSDANGHGNFEYAVPSGYYALNTSNLNTYG